MIEDRAQGRAKKLYDERRRAELDAVKAELPEARQPPGGPPAGQVDLEEMIREGERRRVTRELEGL